MKSFFVSAILSRNKGEGISSEPNCTFYTCVFLKGTVSKSDSVSYASFCLRVINHCNKCGISSYFCETRFGARSARSTREKCFKLFCRRNIVTISTSFEPYLSSLSQNPKYAKACKASMKACQNVTRGILSSALLAEKWISFE